MQTIAADKSDDCTIDLEKNRDNFSTLQNENKVNMKIIFALTLVHFTGDFYSSFSSPLMPVFVNKLSLSLAQVGFITGLVRILSFVIQPCVGYLADRYQTRAFIFCGLLFTIVFIPLSGIANNYYVLMLVMAIGSVGSSMFHPSVTGMVPLYSGSKKGFALSIFNTGGTFAFGVGPIFISWYVASFGLENMPFTMAIGFVFFLICVAYIPMPVSEGFKNTGFIGSLKESIGDVWKPIALIWMVMVLRSVVAQSYMTFMPVYLSKRGHDLVSVGTIVAIFIIAGTISGLISGYLSDKIGYKKIFAVSNIIMIPATLIYLYVPGNWVYLGAFISGFFVFASLPLAVAMAQTLAPKGRSMVSSLMMGLAYGLGGVASPIVGKLADVYSIESVLFYIAFLPLVSIVLIAKFPDVRPEE
ncbi:MAG: MFS transporter [Desulfamplus sp.]|nr:MFS transporter [Desulfamplus sp.]